MLRHTGYDSGETGRAVPLSRNRPKPCRSDSPPLATANHAKTSGPALSARFNEASDGTPRHDLSLCPPGQLGPAPADAAPARQPRHAAGRRRAHFVAARQHTLDARCVRKFGRAGGFPAAAPSYTIVSTLRIERYGIRGAGLSDRAGGRILSLHLFEQRPHRSRPPARAALS